MLRVTGRYNRPVDGGPANQGVAEAGDVPCRVEVGIERVAAGGAIGQFVCNEATYFSDLPGEGMFSWGPYESAGGPAWDPHPVNLRIHGTEGALRVYPYPNKLFYFKEDEQKQIGVLDCPHPAQFGLQIDSFARSIRNDEVPEVTGEDGFRALQIILAAYESYEHLQIISV